MPLVFAAFVVVYFLKMKKEVSQFYDSNHNVPRSHYNRLVMISALDILLNLPLLTFEMIFDIIQEKSLVSNLLTAWPGWKLAHSHIHLIQFFDSYEWRLSPKNLAVQYYNWWKNVALALAFFLLFGISRDMREKYVKFFYVCTKPLGFRPPSKPGPVLPAMSFQAGPAKNL